MRSIEYRLNPMTRNVTQLLLDWREGDEQALEELLPMVYGELRRLAGSYLRNERSDHTLQPTALVHEAYLRLVNQDQVPWQNRAHFIGVAARIMRHILVDHARQHRALKRGGELQKIPLDDALGLFAKENIDLVDLDDALDQLTKRDARQGQVVELRFFGGLKNKEIAVAMSLSESTVKREWEHARAWLFRKLKEGQDG